MNCDLGFAVDCFPGVVSGRIVQLAIGWRIKMSGFLSALLGGSKQVGSGQSTAIANVLQQVLSQNGGGIAALISRFTDAGLGDHVQSWVSGTQQPITADHVDRVFTQDEIANWASQAGTDPDRMHAVAQRHCRMLWIT